MKKDRLFTKKFLDRMDNEQMQYLDKWTKKTISELRSVNIKTAGNMPVSEALVVRMLMERINKGK